MTPVLSTQVRASLRPVPLKAQGAAGSTASCKDKAHPVLTPDGTNCPHLGRQDQDQGQTPQTRGAQWAVSPHGPQKPSTQDALKNQEMRHPDAGLLEKQAEDRSISSCFTQALPNPLVHSWKLLARGETYSITFSVDTKWTETERCGLAQG